MIRSVSSALRAAHRLSSLANTIFSRRDFAVLAACNLLVGMAYSFVLPFASIFGTKEVGMSPGLFSVYMTVTSLSGIALSTVLARWSDTRFSRKSMLLLGGLTGMLGYAGYAYVRDVRWLFLIGSILLGLSSITFSQCFAHARDLLDRSDIEPRLAPFYMNVFRIFFALAWTIGPALAAWVMRSYSFRGTYLVAAGMFAVFMALVAAFVPSVPPSHAARREAAKLPLSEALRLPGLASQFLGFTCYFACMTMSMMNLPLLILNALRGSETDVGFAYSIAPVFELPFMLYLGMLATRMESSRLIRGALLLAIAYYGGLSLVRLPWQVYPLQVLSAAIVAVTNGVAITFFQDRLPGQAGTATNLYSNAMRIGSILGYLLFGYFSAVFGERSVFMLCAGLCGLSLFLMRRPGPEAAVTAEAAVAETAG